MYPSEAIKNNPIQFISYLLVIIGALNWGSIGLGRGDLVNKLVGSDSNYIFIIVGIAGLYLAIQQVYWIYKSNQ